MEKIWLKNYNKNVSAEIKTDTYSSLIELFDEAFRKYKDAPAFTCMGKSITYNELEELSRHFAVYLQSLGLKKGDKFGIQMPNLLQYPVAIVGALRAGLTVVNVNPLYTVREMTHQYKDAGVKAVLACDNFANNLEKTIPNTDIEHVILTGIGDLLGTVKGAITNFVVKNVKKMVPSYHIPQAVRFSKAIKLGKGKTLSVPAINPDDLAFLQYTGGTTGVSKGASLSHSNIIANTLQVSEWFKGTSESSAIVEGKEVMITALPLYHIYALTSNCLMMMHIGANSVLITNPRDMLGFVKTLQQTPFSLITGLNTLFVGLMNTPGFDKIDFSRVKLTTAGGMAMQTPVVERWKKHTGTMISEGYGLSETSPVLTTNPLDGRIKVGSIGLPIPNTNLVILDDNGKEMPLGEVGEICAKGPQVMKGYWNRPEETAKVFNEDGWFKTGDMGYIDEEGYFYIVDRKKDMILVSGFNVYPNEIEEVISGLEGVLEVAVIGIPDEKSTERVKAYVVKKDENLTKEQIIAYCKENLTGYKVPKEIEFRDELPKSNVGKILRKTLKDELKAS
jgi:long-chain acyl-CoA synthetase